MQKITIALKYFAYGLVLGVLFAPRSGQETRQELANMVSGFFGKGMSQGSTVADRVSQRAQETAQRASEKVQQTADKVSEKSEQASGQMSQTGEQMQQH